MRTEHMEQVERWAIYFKENPDKARTMLNKFIDCQISKANDFYKELEKTEDGREKIKKLRELKINN